MSLSFEFEEDTYVYGSCGVQFKGNFLIYGSLEGRQNQISQVSNCALKRVSTLPFSYKYGACAATSSHLLLCFSLDGDGKTCHVSNESIGPFSLISKSIEEHSTIRSATSEGYSIN